MRQDLGDLGLGYGMPKRGLEPSAEMGLRGWDARGGEEVVVCSQCMSLRVCEAGAGWRLIGLIGGRGNGCW